MADGWLTFGLAAVGIGGTLGATALTGRQQRKTAADEAERAASSRKAEERRETYLAYLEALGRLPEHMREEMRRVGHIAGPIPQDLQGTHARVAIDGSKKVRDLVGTLALSYRHAREAANDAVVTQGLEGVPAADAAFVRYLSPFADALGDQMRSELHPEG